MKFSPVALFVGVISFLAACGNGNVTSESLSSSTVNTAVVRTVDAPVVSSGIESVESLPTSLETVVVGGNESSVENSVSSSVTTTNTQVETSKQSPSISTVPPSQSVRTTRPSAKVNSTTTSTSVPKRTRPAPTIAPECDVMPQADCHNVDLRGRELFYANFQGANLSGANMSGMDLTGADFTGANLTGANLIGATLDFGYFFNANLTNAKLTRVSMNSIVWDDTTIWPTGFVPPDY